jgi:hypothetical protein
MKHSITAAGLAAIVTVTLAACSKKEASIPAEPAASVAAAAVTPIAASASVKPFTIGSYEAAAVSDGELSMPNDNKTLAINKGKAEVDAL